MRAPYACFPRAGVEGRLQDAARAVGPGPCAVRSLAAAEDLPGASFAGMYESHLKVAPADLAAAVRRSFDSANADRIRVYESGQVGIGRRYPRIRAAMAVLVQQMVDPVAAGVAFTANPLSDDRNETVCAVGLAERSYPALERRHRTGSVLAATPSQAPAGSTVFHTEHTSVYQVLLGGLAPIMPAPAPHANTASQRWWAH